MWAQISNESLSFSASFRQLSQGFLASVRCLAENLVFYFLEFVSVWRMARLFMSKFSVSSFSV